MTSQSGGCPSIRQIWQQRDSPEIATPFALMPRERAEPILPHGDR